MQFIKQSLILCLLVACQLLEAQEKFGIKIDLPPNQNTDYVARDQVRLKAGTHLTPSQFNGQRINLRIDESFIAPVAGDGKHNKNGYNPAFSTQHDVGKSSWNVGPGGLGEATAGLSIKTLPGVNGMVPSVAISYSSNGGNGIMGFGWSLAAGSSIMRTPKPEYREGAFEDITFSDFDEDFSLDGNRIFSAGSGALQYLENDNNADVFFRNAFSNDSWFEVKYENGMRAEYGNTGNNSRMLRFTNALGHHTAGWMLTKQADAFGNTIEYYYEKVQGEHLLKRIVYGGNENTGAPHVNSIEFLYSKRTDQIPTHKSMGVNSAKIHVLREIQVKHKQQKVFGYTMVYESNVYTLLREVYESNGEGKRLNSTYFDYEGTALNTSVETQVAQHAESIVDNVNDKIDQIAVDLNNDGFDEIVFLDSKESRLTVVPNSGVKEGIFSPTKINYDLLTLGEVKLFKLSFDAKSALVADYNNDGYLDIAILNVKRNDNNTEFSLEGISILFGGNTNLNQLKLSHYFLSGKKNLHLNSINAFYAVGDFDFDGITEIALAMGDDFQLFKPLSTQDDHYSLKKIIGLGLHPNKVYELRSLQFDGFGVPEVLFKFESISKIGSIDADKQNPTVNVSFKEKYNSGFPTRFHDVYIGDFNGDGISDFLTTSQSGADNDKGEQWFLSYGTGNGFDEENINLDPFIIPENYRNGKHAVFAIDIDSDGRSEIGIGEWETPNNDKDLFKFTFFNPATPLHKYFYLGYWLHLYNTKVVFGDFLGLGYQQQLFDGYTFENGNNNGLPKAHITKHTATETGIKLTEMTDGHLLKTKFNYGNFALSRNYFSDATCSECLPINASSLYFLESLEQDNINNQSTKLEFAYRNLFVYKKNKGVLGFQKSLSYNHDSQIGQMSLNKVRVQDDFISLQPVEQFSFEGDIEDAFREGVVQKISETKYSDFNIIQRDPAAKSYKFLPVTVTQQDFLNGTESTSTSSYDADGFISRTISEMGSAGERTTSQTDYLEYDDYAFNSNFSGRAKYPTKTVSTSSTTGSTYGSVSIMSIDEFTGVLHQSTEYKDANQSEAEKIVTEFSYDAYGNLIAENENTLGDASTQRRASYSYTPDHRFVASSTNAKGHVSLMEYDQRFGKVSKMTSPNGLTTRKVYDGWGRIVESYDTYNGRSTVEYLWNPTYNLSDHKTPLYRVKTSDKYGVSDWSDFDRWQRGIGKSTELFNALVVESQKHYNKKGETVISTNMYQAPAEKLSTSMAYDFVGRVKEMTTDGLIPIQKTYQPNSTSSSTPIKSSTSLTDSQGRMTQMQDGIAIVNYGNFDAAGSPREISSPEKTIQIDFDPFGRQKSLNDPDAGITSYQYNYRNELTEQSDANGNVSYDMRYDQLGRLTHKKLQHGQTGALESYTYTYDDAPNAKGKLVTVEGPNGHRTEYAYDKFCRLVAEHEYINGKKHSRYMQYNSTGQLISQSYPSGFTLLYTYNAKGFLTHIYRQHDGHLLWELKSVNHQNNITQYVAGNGKVSNQGFDIYGMPTQSHTQDVSHWVYEWDHNKGQLLSRSNLRYPALSESFQYTVDRLRQINDAQGNQKMAIDYDHASRISQKTDVGAYSYGENGQTEAPNHVVKSISPISGSNPTSTQTSQDISYTAFNSPASISEGDYTLSLQYGHHQERIYTVLAENGSTVVEKTFLGDYEVHEQNGVRQEIHYISAPSGLLGVYVITNGVGEMYYTYTDYLGSITEMTDESGNIVHEQNFDAWGRRRNPQTWAYVNNSSSTDAFAWLRGYTMHEELTEFGLVNMNGRVYDPLLGMMLSPDNYVQDATSTVNFNRYAYVLNNPLKYTDPSGEIVWAPIIIGAIVGAYIGGSTANGTYNPGQWDYQSGKTWGYMLGGAVVGGLSGGIGHAVATSGAPFALTQSIAYSSLTNSIGMHIVTGGQTDVSIGFGFGSYNFTSGEFRSIFDWKDLSTMEKIGYSVGAFANLSDAYGFALGAYGKNAGEADLVTKNDPIGHSAITDKNGNNIVSVGPEYTGAPGESIWNVKGTNDWYNHLQDKGIDKLTVTKIRVTGLRLDKVNSFVNNKLSNFQYKLASSSCVTNASSALLRGGVLNLPFLRHPSLLQLQMFARQNSYFTSFMYNY